MVVQILLDRSKELNIGAKNQNSLGSLRYAFSLWVAGMNPAGIIENQDCKQCTQNLSVLVIVIAQLPRIYGSKPTRVRGCSPRTRAVYVAINPGQLGNKYYIYPI